MDLLIRLRLKNQEDRHKTLTALADAGYKVWVNEVKRSTQTVYEVCFEYKPVEDDALSKQVKE